MKKLNIYELSLVYLAESNITHPTWGSAMKYLRLEAESELYDLASDVELELPEFDTERRVIVLLGVFAKILFDNQIFTKHEIYTQLVEVVERNAPGVIED